MLYKISFEVPRPFSIRQVPARVWATLMEWGGADYRERFSRVLVTTQTVEEQVLTMPKKPGGLDISAKVKVVVALEPKINDAGELAGNAVKLQEKLEELAECLGMEFRLKTPPPVGFDDRT